MKSPDLTIRRAVCLTYGFRAFTSIGVVPQTCTPIMLIVGDPQRAFSLAALRNAGVGLARADFIVTNEIGMHPMALARYPALRDTETVKATAERLGGREFEPEEENPTITVTNPGDRGVEAAFGVIYQVALVGFGRIAERAAVVGGGVAPRPFVTATLSADHRASAFTVVLLRS